MLFARGYSAGLTAMRRVTTRPMLATTVQTAGARMYSTPATTPVRRILRPFYLAGTAVLVTGFALYCTDTRAGIHRYIIPPLLRYFLDGEQAHQFAVKLAKWRITPRDWEPDDPKLMVNLWGKQVSNPIGLAAGFDKNGECIDGMLDIGFGLVEIGSITPKPQPGNPKPRVFRLVEDEAIINRYGFNSDGHDAVLETLRERKRRHKAYGKLDWNKSHRDGRLLGINLGKNKTSPEDDVSDFVKGVRRFGTLADYLVVNVSSPNTPGLRSMQRKEILVNLLKQVKDARDELPEPRPPLLVKIAPDLSKSELADVAAAVYECRLDGIIVANTTISRPETLQSSPKLIREAGGLSGPPVRPLTLNCLREMYRLTGGQIPIIACGGVRTAEDALEYARAGASAIQLYTSMVYEGSGVVRRIKDGIVRELKGRRWVDIIGEDVKGTH